MRFGHGPTAADPAQLDDPENWHGGFYELAIELGPPDDMRLEQALRTLWGLASVEGCFTVLTRNPLQHGPADLTLATLEASYLHGIVRIPPGQRITCGAITVREEDGPDWLVFVLPLGSLSRADRRVGAYPFGDELGEDSFAWRRGIDEWLATIAMQLYAVVPFELALIGFDASGEVSARELAAGVPAERWFGMVTAGKPPEYHPATR